MHKLILRICILLIGMLPMLSCASSPERDAAKYIESMQPGDYFKEPVQITLVEAISQGDLARMGQAIKDGADINKVGNAGMTPLFWAMMQQEFEAYRFLLNKGANPNVTTKLPESAIRETVNSVGFAAEMKDSRYLGLLLAEGGDPNAIVNKWEQTALYDAIIRRQMDNIKLLLQHGADINHQDTSGATPLINAVTARMFEIGLFLVRHGADPGIQTNSGFSAVDFIVKYGDAGIDRRTNDLAAYDEFVQELKQRGLLKEEPPRTR